MEQELNKFRQFFEANLLDGDSVYDCGKAMLLAEDVFEILSPYIHHTNLEARQRQIEWFLGTIEVNSQKDTVNLANMQLDHIKAELAKEKWMSKGLVGEIYGVKIMSKPWWKRQPWWRYRKIANGVWIKKSTQAKGTE